MGYTLAEARTRLREDYLDDPDSDAWTDAQLDRHLKSARSRVLNWFVRRGSQIFRASLSQTAVAGRVDMSATGQTKIVRVSLTNGSHHSVIPYVQNRDRAHEYTGSSTVTIHYDALPAFPANDSTPFVDDVNTFYSLEELCLLRAVETASVKDGEMPVGFVGMLRRLEKDVAENQGQKRVERFPRPAGSSGLFWSYDYSTNEIVLSSSC